MRALPSSRRGRLVAGGTAVLLLAAAGGALAATELDSSNAPQGAVLTDAASRLWVSPVALSSALVGAIDDEINAEVDAGTIGRAQAGAIEVRLASGEVPLFNLMGGGMGPRFGDAGLGVALGAAESYLGLSGAQIRADLAKGRTLAQVAGAQGKSAGGLVAAIVGATGSRLGGAVSAGRLSASQEASIESKLQAAITAIVNGTHPPTESFGLRFGLSGGSGLRGQLAKAATYLGLTTAQVRSDVQSGQTLAQIATAQGKSPAGLVHALVSAVEAKLARAVSAGSLSAAREQSIASRLTRRITDMVDGTRPPGGFHGFGRGFGFGSAGNPGLGGGTMPAGTTTAG